MEKEVKNLVKEVDSILFAVTNDIETIDDLPSDASAAINMKVLTARGKIKKIEDMVSEVMKKLDRLTEDTGGSSMVKPKPKQLWEYKKSELY